MRGQLKGLPDKLDGDVGYRGESPRPTYSAYAYRRKGALRESRWRTTDPDQRGIPARSLLLGWLVALHEEVPADPKSFALLSATASNEINRERPESTSMADSPDRTARASLHSAGRHALEFVWKTSKNGSRWMYAPATSSANTFHSPDGMARLDVAGGDWGP